MKTASVDLWFESLGGVGPEAYRDYWRLLDKVERAKAQRFVRELDRSRYVVSHGKLRRILATYQQLPPAALTFARAAYGKPFLVGAESQGIQFNLAHSGDYLAVAVCAGHHIGVDLELWTDTVDFDAVLELCFAPAERGYYLALPSAQRKAFFYRLWTRKESFVKAVGLGLGLDVAQVVTAPSGASRFLALPAGYGGPECWRLLDLDLDSGLSGALTVPGTSTPTVAYKRLR